MRFNKLLLLIIIWFSLLISCHSFNHEQHITGDYYLIATDNEDHSEISLRLPQYSSYIGRIAPKVKHVFFSETYILAEQQDIKTSNLNYYIIDIEKDGIYQEVEDCVIGPLTKSECKSLTDSLNLSEKLKMLKIE